MKNISKILKQALRKKAINIVEESWCEKRKKWLLENPQPITEQQDASCNTYQNRTPNTYNQPSDACFMHQCSVKCETVPSNFPPNQNPCPNAPQGSMSFFQGAAPGIACYCDDTFRIQVCNPSTWAGSPNTPNCESPVVGDNMVSPAGGAGGYASWQVVYVYPNSGQPAGGSGQGQRIGNNGCEVVEEGCMDNNATAGYHPSHNQDCTQVPGYPSNCIGGLTGPNCCCEYHGCTDINALNHDPNANVDDGSCIYQTFDCIEGNCEENIDGGGAYPDLATCIASDECGRFRCQKNFVDDVAPNPDLPSQSFPDASSTECVPCDQNYYDFTNKQWDPQCKTLKACESDPDCTYKCMCCDGGSGVTMQSQGVGGAGTYGPAGCAQYNGGQFSNCDNAGNFDPQACLDGFFTCDNLPVLLQSPTVQLPGGGTLGSQTQLIQDAYDLGSSNNQAYGVLDGNSIFCLEVCGMFVGGNAYPPSTQFPCGCCGPKHCDDAHLGDPSIAVVPGCYTCGSKNPAYGGYCTSVGNTNWLSVNAFAPGALFYSTMADCQANVLNDNGCKAGNPDDPILTPGYEPDMPGIPRVEPVDPIDPVDIPILDEPDMQEPIQEGIKIKGKLLNKIRMAKLANIRNL